MNPIILDLDQLRAEVDAWLTKQPADRALTQFEIDDYRRRFYLPSWLVEIIERDEAKERR